MKSWAQKELHAIRDFNYERQPKFPPEELAFNEIGSR